MILVESISTQIVRKRISNKVFPFPMELAKSVVCYLGFRNEVIAFEEITNMVFALVIIKMSMHLVTFGSQQMN